MNYTQKTMDHFMNPRNVGEIQDADGIGTVGNPKCGDIMKLYIKVENKDDKKIIVDAKFKTFGCGAAIATSSVLTEKIKGKDIDEVLKLTNKDIMDELGGLPPVKIHCSCLAEQALHAAIFDYAKKNNLVFKNLKQPKNVCPCACKKNN